jgi:peptide/nickel transport system substrate-binding protein
MIVAGCGNRTGSMGDDTIVIAFSNEPNRLNPIFLSDLTSFTLSGWIFNGLTKLDDNLNIVGDLAESWSVSQDGLTITFHLRKGVLWHDGKEFTSGDVLFTFNSIMASTVPSPRSGQFGPVESIDSPNPYMIRVRYREPYGSALMSWTIGIVPAHVLQNSNIDLVTFDRSPVGTGPYRLKEWVSGQKLVFEAFGQHFSGSPKTKHIVVRVLPDASIRLLEMKKGGIDLMELTPLQFAKHTDNNSIVSNFVKYRSPSFRYAFFGFNLLDERFRDKKVRDAIGYAIDRDAMIGSVLFDLGGKSTGPYPPGIWYSNNNERHVQYDPKRAAALLFEAGWVKGNDGILRKGGEVFSFTILTNYENEENSKVAQIIQNNLKVLGVEVKINQLEWQTFRHDVINRHTFDTVVLSRAYMWDPDIFDLWHSSRRREGEWNFMSYQSPLADTLLEQGRKTFEIKKRAWLYKRFHAVIAGEKPCIFLYNADGLFIAHKRIKGVKSSPQGIYQNVKDFFIE